MESLCHRCGNPLAEGESFCSHCGAPQLLVDTSEPLGPQPPVQRLPGESHQVQWHTAITSALLVAIPVGLLSALGAGMSSLLVIAGGFATIALYRKRTDGYADGRMGWRLGAILGLASAAIAAAIYAGHMVILRYLFHQGPAIDHEFQIAAQQSVDYWMKASTQQGPQPPEVLQMFKTFSAFVLSPDGHAFIQLSTVVLTSLGMLLFAATGGAIAGRLLAARPRPQRTL